MRSDVAEIRESIWSIPSNWRAVYIILFTLQGLVGASIVISRQWTGLQREGFDDVFVAIMQDMAWVGAGSATSSVIATETARYVMVIGEWFKRKYVDPLKEQNLQVAERNRQEAEKRRQEFEKRRLEITQEIERIHTEGKAEANRMWKAWNQRRLEAEAKGEVFDEPIPNFRNGSST